MKSSGMIDHNSPASIKASKASLPIARTNGPGYERPERARTSHACEPCRERKTKCDGERPACRRCLHTGTSCHYGYGKGWRKRKTAEDLNATSKKLQRYETLLSDIAPMVPPEVRAMIDEVRAQETPVSSTSEANDSAASSISSSLTPTMSNERETSSSGPTSRIPLTLPMPGGLVPPQSRTQPPLPFDRVPGSTSPHLAHHPKREGFDELSSNRLPSITPNGMLIENGSRDTSPNYPRPVTSTGQISAEHFNSATGSLYGSGALEDYADPWARSNPSPTFRLSEFRSHGQPYNRLPTRLTA